MEARLMIMIFVYLWSRSMNVTLGQSSSSTVLNQTTFNSAILSSTTQLSSTASVPNSQSVSTQGSVDIPTTVDSVSNTQSVSNLTTQLSSAVSTQGYVNATTIVGTVSNSQPVSNSTAPLNFTVSTYVTATTRIVASVSNTQSVSTLMTPLNAAVSTAVTATRTVASVSNTHSGISSTSNKQPSTASIVATHSTGNISVVDVTSINLTQNTILPSSTYAPVPETSSTTNVNPTKLQPLIIAFALQFDENFSADFNDKESLAYLRKQSKILKILNTAYENKTEFLLANVNGCKRDGENILCNGRVYFNNSNINVTELNQTLNSFLQRRKYNFRVAKFEFTHKEQPDKVDNDNDDEDDDDDDDVILGLNWWQIGLIVAGLVILILLIAVICIHAKLQKMKKKNYTENLMYGNQIFGDDENGEMKTMRASPTKLEDDLTMEENHNTIYLNSFMSASPKKDDGLVKETEVKIGMGNETKESAVAPGDVIKL